jgi:Lrp/AsnC family transcriptional regulator
VLEVTSISGTYDYMLKIAAADINAYNDFVMNKLANIPNIGQYHSSIVLCETKKETAYPLK